MCAVCRILALAITGLLAVSSPAAGASPLDIDSVAFGQKDTRLLLDVRTHGPWRSRDLIEAGRSLCVVVEHDEAPRSRGRICVGVYLRATVLRYQRIDKHGSPGGWRRVGSDVARPDERSLLASVAPSEIGLAIGSFTWALQTRWRDDSACVGGCEDRAPNSGWFKSAVTVLAQPPCFGAAARDRRRPCSNPALRYAVLPRPFEALLVPNSPCRPTGDRRRSAVFHPCEFGVTGDQRRATFALIGDSHAATWRAALEVVAQARRWRGVSITRAGCPFSTQVPASPDLGPAECARLYRETLAWLAARREIDTVFISDWAQPPWGPMGGTGAYGGGSAAFGVMLDRIPRSVRHIYVLRDNPAAWPSTASCVAANHRRGRALARVCGVARSAALTPDPGAVAAASRRPRARVIDLTGVFCGPTSCQPVIGGAYVFKDDNHMNATFSTSLGPFVLRALEAHR
ncbi:MAG: hypothetical protein QOJ89_2571 [bacterium]